MSKFRNDEAMMRRGGSEGGKNNKEKKWIGSGDELCPRMLGMRLIIGGVNFVIHRSIDR